MKQQWTDPPTLPLAAEPHIAAWRACAAEAAQQGAWELLRKRLPQLQFPVRQGISQAEAYRAAVWRGTFPDVAADGLILRRPQQLRLWIHDSLAGPVPVLCTADRADFVCLVQALAWCNEPVPVPASQGACFVSGFNNWDRVRHYREQWRAAGGSDTPEAWAAEFRRLIPRKELYQDCFLILAEGPYSNVPAEEMGLPAEEWLRLSLVIRLAHECTHYLTLRLFGSVRDHPLDELIADYVGIAAACGHYRADWFLRFAGRLDNYRGQPPLSDAVFDSVRRLVQAAAVNLERFDRQFFSGPRADQDRMLLVPVLYRATLEELASDEAEAILLRGLAR
jgi:uncharacterized protein DUF7005